MKYLKGFLNFLTGAFFAILTVLSAILCFSLLVYPTNEYIAVILSITLAFAVAFFLNRQRRKMFKSVPVKKPIFAAVTTAVLAVAMIVVFWIPVDTFESTRTVVNGYGLEPEYIKIGRAHV